MRVRIEGAYDNSEVVGSHPVGNSDAVGSRAALSRTVADELAGTDS